MFFGIVTSKLGMWSIQGGMRRTATATPFSTKGREGPRRTATATPVTAEDTENGNYSG